MNQSIIQFINQGESETVGFQLTCGKEVIESHPVTVLREILLNAVTHRIPEMAIILLSPKKTVERWISKLKKMNLIEYRGSKKTGGYFVLNRK